MFQPSDSKTAGFAQINSPPGKENIGAHAPKNLLSCDMNRENIRPGSIGWAGRAV
jgi:hypothetical protein